MVQTFLYLMTSWCIKWLFWSFIFWILHITLKVFFPLISLSNVFHFSIPVLNINIFLIAIQCIHTYGNIQIFICIFLHYKNILISYIWKVYNLNCNVEQQLKMQMEFFLLCIIHRVTCTCISSTIYWVILWSWQRVCTWKIIFLERKEHAPEQKCSYEWKIRNVSINLYQSVTKKKKKNLTWTKFKTSFLTENVNRNLAI